LISYTVDEISDRLQKLGIAPGSIVLVHASLFPLGKLKDHAAADIPAAFAKCIREYLGAKGTLVVPSFNFGFCRGEPFDRARTPGTRMGVLAEVVRKLPGSLRSRHAMQPVSAIGQHAELICDDKPDTAFSPGSAFATLLERNARILLVGADFQAASIIHVAEERERVPYRYYKEFCGEYVDADVSERRCYRIYVRNLELAPKLNMSPVGLELATRGQLRTEPLGGGALRSCDAADLVNAASTVLALDPLGLVQFTTGQRTAVVPRVE
jgi:aminoglycoside 3-N-acetyltransferase